MSSEQKPQTPPSTPRKYEPPAIIFQRRVEAVANTCNFDPPLTKAGGDGCTGLLFS
ncbi:MAG: hypothetical protein V3T77_07780 [Planctomycetota bacterium]